jgi:hypothetical protein
MGCRLRHAARAFYTIQLFSLSAEEMGCLATWKEGNSRYLVAMMNHSHVYTDEARYRCFVYQVLRTQRNRINGEKMFRMMCKGKLGGKNREVNVRV